MSEKNNNLEKYSLNLKDLQYLYIINSLDEENLIKFIPQNKNELVPLAQKLDEIKNEFIKGGIFAVNWELNSLDKMHMGTNSSYDFSIDENNLNLLLTAADLFLNKKNIASKLTMYGGPKWAKIARNIYNLAQFPNISEKIHHTKNISEIIKLMKTLVNKLMDITRLDHNTGLVIAKMMNEHYENKYETHSERRFIKKQLEDEIRDINTERGIENKDLSYYYNLETKTQSEPKKKKIPEIIDKNAYKKAQINSPNNNIEQKFDAISIINSKDKQKIQNLAYRIAILQKEIYDLAYTANPQYIDYLKIKNNIEKLADKIIEIFYHNISNWLKENPLDSSDGYYDYTKHNRGMVLKSLEKLKNSKKSGNVNEKLEAIRYTKHIVLLVSSDIMGVKEKDSLNEEFGDFYSKNNKTNHLIKKALNFGDLYDFYLIASLTKEEFLYLFKSDPEKKFYFAQKLDEIKNEYIKGGMQAINSELKHEKTKTDHSSFLSEKTVATLYETELFVKNPNQLIEAAQRFENENSYVRGYGGEAWAKIATLIYDLSQFPDLTELLIQNKPSNEFLIREIYKLIRKIDFINDVCHNSGIALPKMLEEYKNAKSGEAYNSLFYNVENFLDFKRDEDISQILSFKGAVDKELLESLRLKLEGEAKKTKIHIYNLSEIINLISANKTDIDINIEEISKIIYSYIEKKENEQNRYSAIHIIAETLNRINDKSIVVQIMNELLTSDYFNQNDLLLKSMSSLVSQLSPETKKVLSNDNFIFQYYQFSINKCNNDAHCLIKNFFNFILGISSSSTPLINESQLDQYKNLIEKIKKDFKIKWKNAEINEIDVLDIFYEIRNEIFNELSSMKILGKQYLVELIEILLGKLLINYGTFIDFNLLLQPLLQMDSKIYTKTIEELLKFFKNNVEKSINSLPIYNTLRRLKIFLQTIQSLGVSVNHGDTLDILIIIIEKIADDIEKKISKLNTQKEKEEEFMREVTFYFTVIRPIFQLLNINLYIKENFIKELLRNMNIDLDLNGENNELV